MSRNVYLYKSSQQHGPYRVEDIKGFLLLRSNPTDTPGSNLAVMGAAGSVGRMTLDR